MQTPLAHDTRSGNTVLLLNPDGTAEIWNNFTQRSEHGLSGEGSIRHALRHDMSALTLAGYAWLKAHPLH